MKSLDFDTLSVCQRCGCVFDFIYAIKWDDDNRISVCPACKHEHELPKISN